MSRPFDRSTVRPLTCCNIRKRLDESTLQPFDRSAVDTQSFLRRSWNMTAFNWGDSGEGGENGRIIERGSIGLTTAIPEW